MLIIVPTAFSLSAHFARLFTVQLPGTRVPHGRLEVQADDETEAAVVGDERETEVIPYRYR